ncbi:hypothetical protein CSUB01_07361 [Colletotrichum sublineola]|uniref:Uncharacterized protein n=1 Tax=Colletotrichum sublineola TaxID=1173701 RepID=A0A066X647_COLSU|nr:hypothetical protein CSUB01_07361 [Colletotrichum sublineola]
MVMCFCPDLEEVCAADLDARGVETDAACMGVGVIANTKAAYDGHPAALGKGDVSGRADRDGPRELPPVRPGALELVSGVHNPVTKITAGLFVSVALAPEGILHGVQLSASH